MALVLQWRLYLCWNIFFFLYQLKKLFFSLLKTEMDLIISTMHHWCNLTRCNRPRAINRVAEPSLQSFDELMRFDLTFMQQIRIDLRSLRRILYWQIGQFTSF